MAPAEPTIGDPSSGGHQFSFQASTLQTYRGDAAAFQYSDGANCGFADGHAKWMEPAQTTDDVAKNLWSISDRGDQ